MAFHRPFKARAREARAEADQVAAEKDELEKAAGAISVLISVLISTDLRRSPLISSDEDEVEKAAGALPTRA